MISCQNSSTFEASITRAGMSMNLFSGMTDLFPLCSSLSTSIDLIAVLVRVLHDRGHDVAVLDSLQRGRVFVERHDLHFAKFSGPVERFENERRIVFEQVRPWP